MIKLPKDLTINEYTQGDWDLDNSRVFDIALISDNKHVAGFLEVMAIEYKLDNPTARKLPDKKYWLKRFIINLIASAVEHRPTVISLSKADYDRTLAAIRKDRHIYDTYLSYKTVKALIDWLSTKGYMDFVIGYYNNKKHYGKRTRLIPTKKFIETLNNNNEVSICSIYETITYDPTAIQLVSLTSKDKNKRTVYHNYKDTKETKDTRMLLQSFNGLLNESVITYNSQEEVGISVASDINSCSDTICTSSISSISSISSYKNVNNIYSETSNDINNSEIFSSNNSYILIFNNSINSTIKNSKNNYCKSTNEYISNNNYLSVTRALRNLHLHKSLVTMGLTILRRVFCRGNIKPKFAYGGRYYPSSITGESSWLQIHKTERKTITINGNPTIELDYKALHIRLIYHMYVHCYENLPDDPYEIEYTNDEAELFDEPVDTIDRALEGIIPRPLVKQILLCAINVKDDKDMLKALNYELHYEESKRLKKKFAEVPDIYIENLKRVVDFVLKARPDIRPYLCSDIGVRLQCLDSEIATRVLQHFTKRQLVCLPVHDSFIVEAQYEEELRKIMMDAYEAVTCGCCAIIE